MGFLTFFGIFEIPSIISVNSKPDHPPRANPWEFLERVNSPPPGQRKCNTPPSGKSFSKVQHRSTKHEIEIVRKQYSNANMLRNINSETYKSPKLPGGWLLWILNMSQIILHSSRNQKKKFITSKYQNTTLINNNC